MYSSNTIFQKCMRPVYSLVSIKRPVLLKDLFAQIQKISIKRPGLSPKC